MQSAGGRADARRPAHRGGTGGGMATWLPVGWMAAVLQAGSVVADIRRPWHRHDLVLAADAADERGTAVGRDQRQEAGARVSGEGADAQSAAVAGDGRRGVNCVD